MSNFNCVGVARNPINFLPGSPTVTMAHEHLVLLLSIYLHLSVDITYMCTHALHALLFFFFQYLFLNLFLAVPGLSCVALDLGCGTQTLSCSMHAGSSSRTRARTWAPRIGSAETYPLDPLCASYTPLCIRVYQDTRKWLGYYNRRWGLTARALRHQ